MKIITQKMKYNIIVLITIGLIFSECSDNTYEEESKPEETSKNIEIKLLQQEGVNNCWAAALSMALQVFEIEETEKALDIKFKGNNSGLNLDEVNALFPTFYPILSTDYSHLFLTPGKSPVLSFSKIKASVDNGNPIIIGVNDFEGHLAHALLIYDYDESEKAVIIADPWTGKAKTFSYEALSNLFWSESLIIKKK